MKCRHCNTLLEHRFVDLGHAPPSNAYVAQQQLNEPELYFPLKVYVCSACWLVQVEDYQSSGSLFTEDYAYFSSMSASWLRHAKDYVGMITEKLGLDASSQVIEVASNDGYLLQYFNQKNIPCLGIEPTASTAKVARTKGIQTLEAFFSMELAQRLADEGRQADLVLGNNVLAHVPEIDDFVMGLGRVLKETGSITMEFPHLLNLIQCTQFDTVYHEHYAYLSLHAVENIFQEAGLGIYDVEELPTHGGSLRIYACHAAYLKRRYSERVSAVLEKEKVAGLLSLDTYQCFQKHVEQIKLEFLGFLLEQKKQGKRIAAYGAAAKGNTLLNYCGVKQRDLIDYVVDAAPLKQGKYLPGSHISIVEEDQLKATQPDFVVLFPWNLREELVDQLHYIREWGGRFVVAIPKLDIF